MTVSFIPVYTEYITQRTEKESQEVTHIAFTISVALLFVLTGLGIIFSPILIKIFALTWSSTSEKFQLAVTLNRIMFPYLFFVGLFALSMGILNSLRHFFAPAFATVFLNLSIIVSVLSFYYYLQRPVMALAIGVLVGGILQFLFQIPFLIKKKIGFRFNFNFRHPAIRQIGFLMIPGLIGTAVYQINEVIGTIFATSLPEGSVSYLFYAGRLMEYPLGIFVIAIGTAALPSFSSLVAQGETEQFKETVSFAFRLLIYMHSCYGGSYCVKDPHPSFAFSKGRVRLSCDRNDGESTSMLFDRPVGHWRGKSPRSSILFPPGYLDPL